MLDYDRLMQPLDGAAPCGPDLRGEPEFRDIEDMPGDFANQKVAELRKTIATCDAFLERTKDQTPAIVALQAAVRIGDFDLANAALALVKGYAETYWEDFHPGPASEMAMGRINELTALSRPAAMTLPLQRAALATLPGPSAAFFTAAMVARACEPTPEWSAQDEEKLKAQMESGQLSAALARTVRPNREGGRALRLIMRSLSADARQADSAAGVGGDDSTMDPAATRALATDLRAQVAAARAALSAMSDQLYEINAVYDQRAGDSASLGPVFALLKAIVADADLFLQTFPDEMAVVADAAPDDMEAGEPVGAAAAVGPAGAPRPFVAGVLRTRADVLASIDAICRFYADHEPSSPVPLILRRAQSWVNKDFMQLISELAPQGLTEAQNLLASPAD